MADTAAEAIESSMVPLHAPDASLNTAYTQPPPPVLSTPPPPPPHAVSVLQAERDDLMLHLIFTKGVTEDLQTNVKVMKNVKSKVGAEKSRAEEQKLKQVR